MNFTSLETDPNDIYFVDEDQINADELENKYDDFSDLTQKEKRSFYAWEQFAETEKNIIKSSRFNLDHYRKVKAARLCVD